MLAFAIAALICWVVVLAARPRRPLPGNEVQELVYSRLLGRQQMLMLLALLATGVALLVFVVGLPQRMDPDLRAVRRTQAACLDARHKASDALDYGAAAGAHCYELQPGGTWVQKVERSDGSWFVVGTALAPPP